jgi:hypothetical protein
MEMGASAHTLSALLISIYFPYRCPGPSIGYECGVLGNFGKVYVQSSADGR